VHNFTRTLKDDMTVFLKDSSTLSKLWSSTLDAGNELLVNNSAHWSALYPPKRAAEAGGVLDRLKGYIFTPPDSAQRAQEDARKELLVSVERCIDSTKRAGSGFLRAMGRLSDFATEVTKLLPSMAARYQIAARRHVEEDLARLRIALSRLSEEVQRARIRSKRGTKDTQQAVLFYSTDGVASSETPR